MKCIILVYMSCLNSGSIPTMDLYRLNSGSTIEGLNSGSTTETRLNSRSIPTMDRSRLNNGYNTDTLHSILELLISKII